MTDDEKQRLRELAGKATPGPWEPSASRTGVITSATRDWICSVSRITPVLDVEYIAAISPSVVVGLLDELERLDRECNETAHDRDDFIHEAASLRVQLNNAQADLSTRDAEIAGMRKENERLQAVVEAAENVVAENSTRINHARASKAMVNLYHLIASMPNIEVEGSSAWRSGITASLRCVRYRQSVMPDLQTPAYKQALADIALHLMAMLERNSEKSTTQLAAIDALAPATKEG
jgi:hypothetical protein